MPRLVIFTTILQPSTLIVHILNDLTSVLRFYLTRNIYDKIKPPLYAEYKDRKTENIWNNSKRELFIMAIFKEMTIMPATKIVIKKTRILKARLLTNDNKIRDKQVSIIASDKALNLVIR